MGPLGRPPLNRIPWGLLDLFGIKSMGRNFQHLSEDLSGTIDLLEWFTETVTIDYALSRNNFTALTSEGFFPWASADPALPLVSGAVTTPADEYWLVRRYNVQWRFINGTAAFKSCHLAPGGTAQNNSNRIYTAPFTVAGLTDSSVIIDGSGGVAAWEGFWLMKPGMVPGMFAHSLILPAGEEVVVNGGISLHRLRA